MILAVMPPEEGLTSSSLSSESMQPPHYQSRGRLPQSQAKLVIKLAKEIKRRVGGRALAVLSVDGELIFVLLHQAVLSLSFLG